MNQTTPIHPSVVPASRKKGLAAAINGAVVALAVAAAFLASLSAVRADGDGVVKADGGQVEIDLGGNKPTPSDPGSDNPPPPPPPTAPSDPGPATPPDDATPPAPPADPCPVTPPEDPAPMPPDVGDGDLVTYVVEILIPDWGNHSHGYPDEESARAAGESLTYNPEIDVRPDDQNGGYALWIRVTDWTYYAEFNSREEADAYRDALLAKHNSGRLQVRVREDRN